jgi:hypothetical protein
MKAFRAAMIGALAIGGTAAVLVACGSKGTSGDATSSSTRDYGTSGSTSTGNGTTTSAQHIPMNFLDGQVIVTYPDGGADKDAADDAHGDVVEDVVDEHVADGAPDGGHGDGAVADAPHDSGSNDGDAAEADSAAGDGAGGDSAAGDAAIGDAATGG